MPFRPMPRIHHIFSLLLLLSLAALLPPGVALALEPDEIWEKAAGSVVFIEVEYSHGGLYRGTGFACEFKGRTYIMSNRHVIGAARTVRFGFTTNDLVTAPTYQTSPEVDLAIIEIPPDFKISPLPMRETPALIGERIHVIGFPLGLRKTITQGIINAADRFELMFDAPISSGNSGSPLLDKEGRVIGIATAASFDRDRLLAQKVNVALDLQCLPKLRPFRNAVVGIFDAWRELAAVETVFTSEIGKLKILQVHRYLMNEWLIATGSPLAGHVQAQQPALLDEIVKTHKNLETAAAIAIEYLNRQPNRLAVLPELFKNLQDDDVLAEFLHDSRTNAPFEFQLQAGEIASLLEDSLLHSVARYEDTSYQIQYLFYRLDLLQGKDPGLLADYAALHKEERPRRTAPRLDYEHPYDDFTEADYMDLFLDSLLPFSPPIRHSEERPAIQDQVKRHGGFEDLLLDMFGRMAEEQMEKGNIRKARGYLLNEAGHRLFHVIPRHGRLAIIAGEPLSATAIFERGVELSRRQADPFRLNWRYARSIKFTIYDTMLHEQKEDTVLPEKLRANLAKYRQDLKTKGWARHALTPPAELFSSTAFSRMKEFEKMGIIWLLEKGIRSSEEKQTLEEAINQSRPAIQARQKLHAE